MKPQDILLFHSADNKVNVSVYFEKGTFWLTQKTMAELFGVERSVVTKHLKNIFKTAELEEDSVRAKIAHTASKQKSWSRISVVSILETTAAGGKNHESKSWGSSQQFPFWK